MNSVRRRCAVVLLAAVYTPAAWGDIKNWIGGTSTWDNPAAWSPVQIPQSTDLAYISQTGAVVTYQNPSTPTGLIGLLQVDAAGAGSQVIMTGGQLTTSDTEIGDQTTGTFTQSGGTHTETADNGFYLGRTDTGVGTYNLSGTGALIVNDELYVGLHGIAVFNQTGGSVSLGAGGGQGLLTLANGKGSGTYNLSAGTLSGKLLIVDCGTLGGLFKQTGGTATFTGGVDVEASFGSTTTYELSGTGKLTDSFCAVGFGNTASTFKQLGGTHIVTGNLSIGNGLGGDYILSGGSLSTGQTLVGANSKGKFDQSGGTHTITGALQLGSAGGAKNLDVFNLSGGTLTSGTLTLSSSGFFNQTAGTTTTQAFAMLGNSTYKLGGGTLKVATLQLDATKSKLDLANQGMLVDYTGSSPILTIRAYALSGYNGGAWTGTGLTSTTAAANPSTRAVGFGEAKDVLGLSGNNTATWDGYTVDATSILVRYTLAGDANLDGSVGFADLVKVAQNYGNSSGSAIWTQGDFDYDGKVDFSDLVKVAQTYGGALPASVPEFGASFEGDLARAFAVAQTPEPGSAGVILLAVAGAVGRRRSRKVN